MTTALTANPAQLKSDYDRDGIVVARSVLDAELVAEAREHVDWLTRKHPDIRPEMLNNHLATNDPFWIRLVSDERLVDLAEAFIGPNVALFATHYVAKPPREGLPVLWHQDGSYWPLSPMRVVSLWLAITPSRVENGCMRVIPGTQFDELKALKERDDVASVLSTEIDGAVDESRAIDVELEPGDVSIHHPNLIHGSNANQSEDWRIGLTIRYIPTYTRIGEGDTDKAGNPTKVNHPFLLRGDRVPGINQYQPYPRFVHGEHMSFRGCEKWM